MRRAVLVGAAALAVGVLAARARATVPALKPAPEPVCPAEPRVAPAGPWSASAALGASFGYFYSTQGTLVLAVGRTFRDRLELEASVRLGGGDSLFGVEESLRPGVLVHLGSTIDLLFGLRVGYAAYRLFEVQGARWEQTLALGLLFEIRLRLRPALELRVAPLAVAGYLVPPLWGYALEPHAGVAWRF